MNKNLYDASFYDKYSEILLDEKIIWETIGTLFIHALLVVTYVTAASIYNKWTYTFRTEK